MYSLPNPTNNTIYKNSTYKDTPGYLCRMHMMHDNDLVLTCWKFKRMIPNQTKPSKAVCIENVDNSFLYPNENQLRQQNQVCDLRFSFLPFSICNIVAQRSIVLNNTGNHKDQTTEDFPVIIAPLISAWFKNCTLIVVDAGPLRFWSTDLISTSFHYTLGGTTFVWRSPGSWMK